MSLHRRSNFAEERWTEHDDRVWHPQVLASVEYYLSKWFEPSNTSTNCPPFPSPTRPSQVRQDAPNTLNICMSCLSTAFPCCFLLRFFIHTMMRDRCVQWNDKQRLWSRDRNNVVLLSVCTFLWETKTNEAMSASMHTAHNCFLGCPK